MSSDALRKDPKRVLVKKSSFLNSHESIRSVGKFLLLVLVIIELSLLIIGARLYIGPHEAAEKLLMVADGISKDISDRLLSTSKTYAAKIATEYRSVTHLNTDVFIKTFSPMVWSSNNSFKAEMDRYVDYVKNGSVMQEVVRIDYSKITEEQLQKFGKRQYVIYFRVPMTVRVWKQGLDSESVLEEIVCGIKIVHQNPSELNPSGVYVLSIGNEVLPGKRPQAHKS